MNTSRSHASVSTLQPQMLIVDDEAVIRDTLRWLLEDAGYVVHEATNGLAAIDLLTTSAADQNLSGSTHLVSDARGHQRIFEDFLDAIRTGREPACSGREGRRSVALVCAIYDAAKSGQWVEVAD